VVDGWRYNEYKKIKNQKAKGKSKKAVPYGRAIATNRLIFAFCLLAFGF
jgi:hypothetical protein